MQLIESAIHRRFNVSGGPALLAFAHEHVLQARDDAIDCVLGIDLEIGGLVFDRAVNIDHLFAVRSPTEDAIKKSAFAVTFEEKVQSRGNERDRHERKIAHVVEQHLELKNNDIAQKSPARLRVNGTGLSWRIHGSKVPKTIPPRQRSNDSQDEEMQARRLTPPKICATTALEAKVYPSWYGRVFSGALQRGMPRGQI